jgi:hypothetical protein
MRAMAQRSSLRSETRGFVLRPYSKGKKSGEEIEEAVPGAG